MLITSAIISGIGLGAMYGLIALGFHVTYVVSNTVNFSQGSAMMLGAVLGYSFAVTLGWPIPIAVMPRCCCARCSGFSSNAPWCGLSPSGLERLADGDGRRRHRPRQSRALHLRQGAAQLSVFLARRRSRFSARASIRCQLIIPVVGIAAALAFHLVSSHRTRNGKALLAVVQNPDAARLMGINVRGRFASYVSATVLAGIADS